MSSLESESILLLAAVAGLTIVPALLAGRLRRAGPLLSFALRGGALGILLYLLLDLVGHARELPLEVVERAETGAGDRGLAVVVAALSAVGLVAGWFLLAALARRWARPERGGRAGEAGRMGREPGAAEYATALVLLIAVGVGLYNFLQGMSIGQAGRFTVPTAVGSGAGTALLLFGFLLQNSAKALAIMAPMAAAGTGPSWRFLVAVAALAGLPTLLGALLGLAYWNPYLFVGLFTLAVGAVLFVTWELLRFVRRRGEGRPIVGGLLGGFVVATLTTLVLEFSHYSLPELMSSFWI